MSDNIIDYRSKWLRIYCWKYEATSWWKIITSKHWLTIEAGPYQLMIGWGKA